METWRPKDEWNRRPYRNRYQGLRRQIARANGLHPIKDRVAIDILLPGALALAKQAKERLPRMRYREVEITAAGVRVQLPRSGPEWSHEAL
jgi:hypothetical protein